MCRILYSFAALAIFISCLGLYGLVAFTAEQRTKEIGIRKEIDIRKVLGASVFSLVGVLSKDFVKLVIVAFVVAAPVAWYAMQRWLQDFEYRVPLGWQTCRRRRVAGPAHCPAHGEFPGSEGGPDEPSGEPEERVGIY